MRATALIVAGLTTLVMALGAAAPAQAQAYGVDPHCAQQRQNRMVAGALIGGVAGAVLGNNVAARNAQTEGTVLGGAVGAAAGAAIGRQSARCDNNAYSQYQQRAPDPYYNPSGLYGAPPQNGYYGTSNAGGYGYGSPQQECRWGEQRIRDRNGRWQSQDVYLCQGPDGVWRAQ
ncbi:MAG: glycine zipper 2TM domain-containing protein [Caulobacterales bacterium]|jgi:uncharacterized protein YcfJ